jgi:cytochrome c-type biogenesis protein CcmF
VLDARANGRPRSWAGHVAHLGIVVLAVGVAGTATGTEVTAGLDPGDQIDVGPYTLELVETTVTERDTGPGLTATVEVTRDGSHVAELEPELNAYPERGIVLAESALRSTPLDDLQVAIRNAGDDGTVLLEAGVRPLTMWVWWGAVILVVAGAMALGGGRWRRAGRGRAPTSAQPVSSLEPSGA